MGNQNKMQAPTLRSHNKSYKYLVLSALGSVRCVQFGCKQEGDCTDLSVQHGECSCNGKIPINILGANNDGENYCGGWFGWQLTNQFWYFNEEINVPCDFHFLYNNVKDVKVHRYKNFVFFEYTDPD